jgi:hypothetical protein
MMLAIAAVGMLIAGCGWIGPWRGPTQYGFDNPYPGRFESNGQQIYFTATNQNGRAISYAGGPRFGGMMMGGYLTCASCHGADGRGGIRYIHMDAINAPPIYYDALADMLHEESGHTAPPATYAINDFRQAVVHGKHPDGDALDRDMPRWRMSQEDLVDLLDFLKTLP